MAVMGILYLFVVILIRYIDKAVGDILPITSNETQSGTAPTLGGPGYPNSTLPANKGGICSVAASCGTTINVIAADVNFQTDRSGSCRQYIDIEESGSNQRRIECVDNNNKKPRVLYSSQTHFLILRYNNTLSTDAGDLWLQFNGTHGDASIEIKCGMSIRTTPPSVPGCPGTGPPREKDPALSGGQIAAVIIGIIFLLLALIILIMLRYKLKKAGKMSIKVSHSQDLLPSDEFAKALGIHGKPAMAGVAPASSSRPPRLTPMETTTKTHLSKDMSEWDTAVMKPTSTITKGAGTNGISSSGTIKTSVFELAKD